MFKSAVLTRTSIETFWPLQLSITQCHFQHTTWTWITTSATVLCVCSRFANHQWVSEWHRLASGESHSLFCLISSHYFICSLLRSWWQGVSVFVFMAWLNIRVLCVCVCSMRVSDSATFSTIRERESQWQFSVCAVCLPIMSERAAAWTWITTSATILCVCSTFTNQEWQSCESHLCFCFLYSVVS